MSSLVINRPPVPQFDTSNAGNTNARQFATSPTGDTSNTNEIKLRKTISAANQALSEAADELVIR